MPQPTEKQQSHAARRVANAVGRSCVTLWSNRSNKLGLGGVVARVGGRYSGTNANSLLVTFPSPQALRPSSGAKDAGRGLCGIRGYNRAGSTVYNACAVDPGSCSGIGT